VLLVSLERGLPLLRMLVRRWDTAFGVQSIGGGVSGGIMRWGSVVGSRSAGRGG
jgi:hypothetical protein